MTPLRLLLLAPLMLPAVPNAGPLTLQPGPYRIGSACPVPIPTCWDLKWLPVKDSLTGNGAKVPCQAEKVNAGR